MTRPAVFGPTDAEFHAASLEVLAMFDTWMSDDPTCKTIEDPAARVRAICAVYGAHLKPAWEAWRVSLGQPIDGTL